MTYVLTGPCNLVHETLVQWKPPEEISILCPVNKIEGNTSMNNVKKIGILLLVLGVIAEFTQAAKHEKPDATIKLKGGSVAAGIGYSWGSGTLTYQGKEYPVSVNGLSLGKVGISGSSATGEVYHLNKIEDFNGHYNAGSAGLTIAGGASATAMKNQNGVSVVVTSTSRGADVTIAGGGVDIQLKK